MKNKIITVTAFLAVMFAITGIAAANGVDITQASTPITQFDTPPFTPITGTNAASNPVDTIFLNDPEIGGHNVPAINTQDVIAMPNVAVQLVYSLHQTSNRGHNYTLMVEELTSPIDFRFNTVTPDPSGTFTAVGGTGLAAMATWSIPGINQITGAENAITVTIPANAPSGLYKFKINMTSTDLPPPLDNSSASRFINIIRINPSTNLTKTANPTTLSLIPGGSGTVTYTITETNNGSVPLMTTVSDPGVSGASCTPTLPDTRQYNPGDSVTFTCTKTYNDSEQGTHINTVTATGHPIVNNVTLTNVTVNESANATVNIITVNTTLTKTANPDNLTLSPGGNGTVTYTITETNTGDVPLMTTVSDPGVPGASCIPPLPDTRRYNPGDSVTFTCTKTYNDSEQGVHTNTVTATSNPIVNNVTLTNVTFNESANATVNVITTNVSCPTGDCKFKTWGTLGNVANPEKKFEMLFFSPIPHAGTQGRMVVEDNNLHITIESTQVDTIVTNKTAGTGTATGRAHVTSTGGTPPLGVPGDYNFTVNVVDAAHSGTPRGTFELILQGFPGGYDNKGNLSFGAITIIK